MTEAVANRRIVVTKRGGPDVLQVVAEPVPEPKVGEVRVKVLAAGVSSYEVMLRGHWFPGNKPPYTPGEDAVGLVDKLGDDVAGVFVGDRVGFWTFGNKGCYAEYICVPVEWIVPVPDDLPSAPAVSLITNYLTASLALHQTAKVEQGERVLAHGAAGGVGSAVVQLGRLAELEMYGTCSRHNFTVVESFGATPIDYRNDNLVERIKSLTGGEGVDVVIDVIGGGRQLWRSQRVLRKGGRLLMLGMSAAVKGGSKVVVPSLAVVAMTALLPNGKSVPMGGGMDKYPAENMQWYRDALAEFFDLAVAGKLTPLVAEEFPLTEAWRSHERMERGGQAGKVVLVAD